MKKAAAVRAKKQKATEAELVAARAEATRKAAVEKARAAHAPKPPPVQKKKSATVAAAAEATAGAPKRIHAKRGASLLPAVPSILPAQSIAATHPSARHFSQVARVV